MTTITADELRAELDRLNLAKTFPKGFTSSEFGDTMGCCGRVARERINKLIKGGRAKFAGNRPIMRMDGKPSSVPVYQLLKK